MEWGALRAHRIDTSQPSSLCTLAAHLAANPAPFFIKSERPREGMTWLLQLIFFLLSNPKVQFPLEEGVCVRAGGFKMEYCI